MPEKDLQVFPWEVHEKYVEQIRTGLPNWTGIPDDLVMLCKDTNPEEPYDRSLLILAPNGQETGPTLELHVNSLRELFRGDVNPGEFNDYPKEYLPFFIAIEKMIAERARYCDDRPFTDDSFIEVYSTMRRRPDGKSTGFLHDLVWQRAAYFMLVRRCSQFEYESCIQKMERGVRKFHMNFASYNYYNYVVNHMDLLCP